MVFLWQSLSSCYSAWLSRFRATHLQKVAVGCTQGIGGIHELRAFVFAEYGAVAAALPPPAPSKPVPCPVMAILIFSGAYSWIRNTVVDGGCDGYTLRPASLTSTARSCRKRGSFDGHLIGQITVDDASYPVEDLAQPKIGMTLLAHVDDAHHHQFSLVADDA